MRTSHFQELANLIARFLEVAIGISFFGKRPFVEPKSWNCGELFVLPADHPL